MHTLVCVMHDGRICDALQMLEQDLGGATPSASAEALHAASLSLTAGSCLEILQMVVECAGHTRPSTRSSPRSVPTPWGRFAWADVLQENCIVSTSWFSMPATLHDLKCVVCSFPRLQSIRQSYDCVGSSAGVATVGRAAYQHSWTHNQPVVNLPVCLLQVNSLLLHPLPSSVYCSQRVWVGSHVTCALHPWQLVHIAAGCGRGSSPTRGCSSTGITGGADCQHACRTHARAAGHSPWWVGHGGNTMCACACTRSHVHAGPIKLDCI